MDELKALLSIGLTENGCRVYIKDDAERKEDLKLSIKKNKLTMLAKPPDHTQNMDSLTVLKNYFKAWEDLPPLQSQVDEAYRKMLVKQGNVNPDGRFYICSMEHVDALIKLKDINPSWNPSGHVVVRPQSDKAKETKIQFRVVEAALATFVEVSDHPIQEEARDNDEYFRLFFLEFCNHRDLKEKLDAIGELQKALAARFEHIIKTSGFVISNLDDLSTLTLMGPTVPSWATCTCGVYIKDNSYKLKMAVKKHNLKMLPEPPQDPEPEMDVLICRDLEPEIGVKNLFSRRFPTKEKEMRILMVGLDGSGKTTIANKLKLGEIITTTIPTIGFNVETVKYQNISFTVWDVRGQDKFSDYFRSTHGLIFVVDSNARDRVVEARDELHRMLKKDELRDAVLLVFANKQDLPNAMNTDEITDKLGLRSLREGHWHIQCTIATFGEGGLYDGLDWLSNNIADKIF